MDVLSLLRSKNRCLRKFLEASTGFLAEAERSGQLPDVLAFEQRREAILKAIDLYDRKISEAVALLGSLGAGLADGIRASLGERENLVHRVLLVDDRILQLIEAEKSRILKELALTQKQAEIAQKFKSTWVREPGEGIDEKL